MSARMQASFAALGLALFSGCANGPTLESIRHGYRPPVVEASIEPASQSEANDVAAGWTPERDPATGPVLYGRDGSPVGASTPGSITQTSKPINGGVDVEGSGGGSRSLLLDLYTEAVEDREDLVRANDDLEVALELSETRSADLERQLASMRQELDALGREKTQIEQQSFDLAARLATAQIARLEAERALLEATLEWRRMTDRNNAPLDGSEEGP